MKHARQVSPAPADVPQRHAQTVLRQMEICQRLGISDETWRQWVRRGYAPQPVPGFPRLRPRWRVSDIERLERGGSRHFGSHRRSVASVTGL